MARSRTYVRDSRGRFASTGGGGGGKGVKRGRTELIRARRSVRQARGKLAAFDPADQSNKSALSKRAQRGAVTRAEKRLAAVRKTAVIKGARVSGTISKNRRQRPAAAPAVTPAPAPAKGTAPKRIRAARPAGTISKSRQPVMRTTPMGNNRVPASQRPGSVTSTLRETLRTLAQLDAKRIREIEAITGQKLTVPQGSMSRKARPQSGSVAGALRETLRTLAQSDARMARETDAILREATRKLPGGKGGGGSKRVKGGASSKALPEAAAPAPGKPKRSRGGGQAAAKPAAAPAKPKRSAGSGKAAAPTAPAPAKPARTINRTRKQAAQAQRERNRRIFEFAGSSPDGFRGLTRKLTKVAQGNLLTGRTDTVVAKVKTTVGPSRIGQSSVAKKTATRRARAEARYNQLIQERKAIMGKGRVKSGELARNSQRMGAVGEAFRVYDMGTGRRPPRRRTGRAARNSSDRN